MADNGDRARLARMRHRQSLVQRLWIGCAATAVVVKFAGYGIASTIASCALATGALANFGLWFALLFYIYELEAALLESELES